MVEFLIDAGKGRPRATVLLAHGAGAPMDSPFMGMIAAAIKNHGLSVLRFEFGYMAARRQGSRKPPSRMPGLIQEYQAAIADAAKLAAGTPLLIGGKSMGGRVASMIADDVYEAGRICGCVCLGYPFHPSGRPAELRTAHLNALKCPTLIVQGERDALGNKSEVTSLDLSRAIKVVWIKDGDHDLKPRIKSASTMAEAIEIAAAAVARFAERSSPGD